MLNHKEYREQKRRLIFEEGTQIYITIEEISQFEKENKIKIPEQYLDFLIRYNGVKVNTNNCYLISEERDEYLGILGFTELKNAEIGQNENNFDEETGTIKPPKGLMSLAYMEDSPHTEMFICIEENENYGKVYYCEDRVSDFQVLVSDSFNEFINSSYTIFNYEWEEVCEYGFKERAKELIQNDYKVEENDFNLLGKALDSSFNMNEAIIKIIERGDNIEGMLCFSAYKNNFEIVKELFNKGCNINEFATYNEYLIKMKDTPLLAAIRGVSSIELIEYLLKNGANTKLRNLEDKDALRAINTQKTNKKGYKWK